MPIRKNKTLRDKLEHHIEDLASQTDELRQQVVDRAPGVRDQLIAALPDKDQLVDLRDDLFEKLPEGVQEKLPERVKPRRRRLRKVAVVGVLTGAGAAAFAILKRRGDTPPAYTPPPPTPPRPASPAAPKTPPAPAAATGDPLAPEPPLN